MDLLRFLWGSFFFVVLVLATVYIRQYYLQGWIEQIPVVRNLDDSYERAKKAFAVLGAEAIKEFYESKGRPLRDSDHFTRSRDGLAIQSTWNRDELLLKFQRKGFSRGRLEAAARVLDYVDSHKHFAMRNMYEAKVLASVQLAQALLESDIGRSRLAREGNNHFGIKGRPTKEGRRKIARIKAGHTEELCYCRQQTDFVYKAPAIGTMNVDDDHHTDAFEVYATVADSYRRHTELLTACGKYGQKGCYGWIWKAFPVGSTADITQLALDHRRYTGMAPRDYFGGEVETPYYAAAASGLKAAFYATSKAYPRKIRSLIETYELWRFDYDIIHTFS